MGIEFAVSHSRKFASGHLRFAPVVEAKRIRVNSSSKDFFNTNEHELPLVDHTNEHQSGTAILTTVSAVAWWTSAMMRAARRFRAWVRNALDRMLVNTN